MEKIYIFVMNQLFLVTTALLTASTYSTTVAHIGNCTNVFAFVEVNIPGTKFTCTDQSTNKIWDCKLVEAMFPICEKKEQCKSFNCQHRPSYQYFHGSNFDIAPEEGQWLLNQIQVPNLSKKQVLLYQATRDGWYTTDYHTKVNGFNNTYTFLKFKWTQRRAAAFTSLAQIGGWVFTRDDFAFILSIDKRIVARALPNQQNLVLTGINGPYIGWERGFPVLGAPYDVMYAYGSAQCERDSYNMPHEDNEKKVCSLSGLNSDDFHVLDEIEVWQIL
ncbi:hypothetical protein FGO68_gene9867 [Halteria grandinella]|uniref:TLDc domain-containing protein n=1 Tax=Halteria grandinella TaxID=5974 RepID=A0A8J8NC50_HALGN|nr:hypothetical protein FGO68_gene9867 [Halteria grandinella]